MEAAHGCSRPGARHPGWWGLTWQPVPLPPANTRPVFQRSVTIGGLSITSPSDWVLVDYLGLWNADAVPLDSTAVPVLELTNFDPGLSTPVCDTAPGGPTRLPADGVAILAMVGNGGGNVDDSCGRDIAASATGTTSSAVRRVPYRFVLAMGPNVTERDRTDADQIWRSLTWITSLYPYARGAPASVRPRWLPGWGRLVAPGSAASARRRGSSRRAISNRAEADRARTSTPACPPGVPSMPR